MRVVITSSQNKIITQIKSLHAKKYRDNMKQYIIEGYKLMDEALQYNKAFALVLISDSAVKTTEGQQMLWKCEDRGIATFIVDDRIFLEASEMETPQGVLAVIHKQEQELEAIISNESYILMLLDEVRDPGNVGTIIRTADACGIAAVVLSKGCVDLYNGKTIRATMGSMFHIPVITDVDILELIEKLKLADAVVMGADPHSNISCVEAPLKQRTAIVIGNEANGMSDEVKAAATQNVTIPMPGKAESLNAGIAAAILMYEFAVRKGK